MIEYLFGAIVLILAMLYVTILAISGHLSSQDIMIVFMVVLQIIAGWFGIQIGYRLGKEVGREQK